MPTNSQNDGIGYLAALKGMFSFYTMLPIDIEQRHMDSMNRKFWLCPIVGLFYGLLLVTSYILLFHYTDNALVAAGVSIFIVSAFNRFLHLDGTIDIGDGLTVAGTREDHVRALKDTRVGAGGVCMGIFVILLMLCGYASLGASMLFLGFAIEVFAKNASVVTAAFGNAGEGMAAESIRNTQRIDFVKSSILSIVLVSVTFYLLTFIDSGIYQFDKNCALVAVVGFVVSVLWGMIMAWIGNGNFGKVNGDVLGATNETYKALFSIVAVILFATVTL